MKIDPVCKMFVEEKDAFTAECEGAKAALAARQHLMDLRKV